MDCGLTGFLESAEFRELFPGGVATRLERIVTGHTLAVLGSLEKSG
jgi:hypothetical protein